MRILVVEDERTLAGFVEQSLRSEGHTVTVCRQALLRVDAQLAGWRRPAPIRSGSR